VNRFLSCISLLALAASSGVAMTSLAHAVEAKSTFAVLYTFTGGNDGANPISSLIADRLGNLRGTASRGGAGGAGVVYELAPPAKGQTNWTETTLLGFDGTDGDVPGYGHPTLDNEGNLYGATVAGGSGGYGNVYMLTPDNNVALNYVFTGGSDGEHPYSDIVVDKHGDVYGTTYEGGANGAGGTVYEVMPSGIQTVLYSFCSQTNCTDGAGPFAQLLIDKKGNLYGTTVEGGAGAGGGGDGGGTIFELSPPNRGQQTWTETVLYSFQNTPDPKIPFAGLIADESGNFYGTTDLGGTGSCDDGCGAVFELAPDTGQCTSISGWCETTLYNFQGGNDGQNPWAALVEDKNGNLYGTTTLGGADNDGTVFKLAPDGTETILYTFTGGNDGANPYAALHLKGSYLYGTADSGGAEGYGTVFKVKD